MMRRPVIGAMCAMLLVTVCLPLAGQKLTVDEVLERHAKALGGADRAKIESLELTGSFNFNGVDSPYTVYRQRPDRYRIEIETTFGTVISAFDGDAAWSQRPDRSGQMTVRKLEGEELQRFIDENTDFDGPLINWAAKGHKVKLVGETDVDGVAVHHLEVALASGSVQRWFLSRDDHLAVRKVTTAVHRRAGPYDRIWYLMEYQATAGITLPFYVEREDRQHVRAYTVEKVEVGVEIDPTLFQPPE